ncbi:hypothetical protein ACHAWF_005592 [Thalassiosira exigua]
MCSSRALKFIKYLDEEGYDCDIIRMELTKNDTLHTLIHHELTHKEDWAYHTATRTFVIRFDEDMEALQWKVLLERNERNNCRVRRGLYVPDGSTMDDMCSSFKNSL